MQAKPMQANEERALRGLLLLGGLFIAALVTCNLIATKFTSLSLDFGFVEKTFIISVGILPYPLTFLITDILSEVYGRKRANQVVFCGLFASLLVAGILFLALPFEAIEGSAASTQAFTEVFGKGWRVILASMVAYLVAQFVDIRIFHFWKRVTKGRHLWWRNNVSTVFSQLVDTTLVVCVLFVGVWPVADIQTAILDGWLFKVLCALVDTPLCYLGVYGLRRYIAGGRPEHFTIADHSQSRSE